MHVDEKLKAPSYQDKLLKVTYNHIVAYFGFTEDVLLLEDLAPPRNTKSTRAVLHELDLYLLPWVGQGPELNLIENAWAEVEWRLRRRRPVPTTQVDLFRALLEEWQAITDAYLKDLADSMVRWCAVVAQSKGWPTKY